MNNPVCWFEIYVKDMKRAKTFYKKVFNLKFVKIQAPGIEMWGFPSDLSKCGCSGALVKMKGVNPEGISTIVYFSSKDCKVEEKRIVAAGGDIHKSKTSIGKYGFITLACDTEGNMFGIHSLK